MGGDFESTVNTEITATSGRGGSASADQAQHSRADRAARLKVRLGDSFAVSSGNA